MRGREATGAPAEGAEPARKRIGFRPDVEGLRFVALLAIFLYHAHLPFGRGGIVGPDVFFVVSGFLITRLLVDEAERTGSIALGRFYAYRMKRLLPLAATVLVAVVLQRRIVECASGGVRGGSRLQLPTPRSGKVKPVQIDAHAFWLSQPGRGEIRPLTLPEPGLDEVLVRTLRSGISRGTETLVFRGGVAPGQYAAMRAPFQEGDFPGPVKYGYLSVGAVEQGPPELSRRTVFCLYPHQTAYVVPTSAVTVVPEGVPPARAVLAGTVETAVNALWDAAPLLGDRVSVVGGGMVGCCVARLLSQFPAAQITLVDVDPGRADVAAALGVDFALPADAADGRDLVVHASATSAGLQRSLDLLAPEGTVIDLSWYGETEVHLSLGGAFHAGRLGIRASQVGTLSPARSGHRTMAERLALALDLLQDPAFDALLTGQSRFDELPEVMARLAAGNLPALCHTIIYDPE